MASAYQVTCDRCSYESKIVWPLWACYQWPSGHTLEIAQRLSWCNGCAAVTVVESLTELERIDRLRALSVIANAYDGERKIWSPDEIEAVLIYARYPRFANLYGHLIQWKKWDVKQSVVMTNTLNLHREWRLARTSPPSCLACGRTDFVALAVDKEGELGADAHPGCGGQFTFVKMRKVRVQRCLWTVEGQRIGFG